MAGPATALDIILSGRHVGADEAQRLGIVDAIVDGTDLRAEAIHFAKGVAARRPLPRARDSAQCIETTDAETTALDAARKSIARVVAPSQGAGLCARMRAGCTHHAI
ncbi:hypothetical protein ACTMU2_16600 [Cupriavidus basilensis]